MAESDHTCSILFMDDGVGIPRRVLQVLRADETENQADGMESQELKNPLENRPHVMGLKIVRQIVKAHGGDVEFFEPQANQKGCRIAVTLPAH